MVMFEIQDEGKRKVRLTIPNYVVVLIAAALIIGLAIVVVMLYPDILSWLR